MSNAFDLVAPVRVIHRAGVTFGDRTSWGRVRDAVADLGPRPSCSSEAGNRFDQNITGFRAEEEMAFNADPFVLTGRVPQVTGI